MKHYILGILLLATSLAFAQVEPEAETISTEQTAPIEQAAPEESAVTQEQAEPSDLAAPERTPEGYRIIRIDIQETKV